MPYLIGTSRVRQTVWAYSVKSRTCAVAGIGLPHAKRRTATANPKRGAESAGRIEAVPGSSAKARQMSIHTKVQWRRPWILDSVIRRAPLVECHFEFHRNKKAG